MRDSTGRAGAGAAAGPRPPAVVAAMRPAEMARALGLLYVAGGALALVWTRLPHGDRSGDAVVALMAVVALLLGGGLLTRVAERLPVAAVHTVLVAIQLVIAVAYAAAEDPGNDIRLFFVWATPFAALYFGRRVAAAHVAWTAVTMAGALLAQPAGFSGRAPSVFVMTLGAVATTGALVSWAAWRLRAAEVRQRWEARHDALTGLPNRLHFAESANQALARWRAEGGSLAVALIDLDRFKLVNDTYGHATGDRLLQAVAPLLRGAVRGGDLVARLGGDEFVLLTHDPGALDVAELTRRLGEVWGTPLDLGVTTAFPSGTTGVALARSPLDTAESLLRDADAALYRAKALGRGGWSLHDDALTAALTRRLQVEQRLRLVLEHGGSVAEHDRPALSRALLDLVYEPVADLTDGSWRWLAARPSWDDVEVGLVAPEELGVVAEEAGLSAALGEAVLRHALSDLSRLRSSGALPLDVGVVVPVGRHQIGGLADRVGAALRSARVPGECLQLAVGESTLRGDGADLPPLAAEADRLAALGVGLLVDGVGVAASSLTRIRQYPVRALRLDRAFVAALPGPDAALVGAARAVATALGAPLVADGVTTAAQAAHLLAQGCRWAQGPYVAPVLSAPAIEARSLPAAAEPA
ncbi:MAG: putative bifunctional diguanylate cyclase/phosphodiesterase [Motilibacteraceae bacterium]